MKLLREDGLSLDRSRQDTQDRHAFFPLNVRSFAKAGTMVLLRNETQTWMSRIALVSLCAMLGGCLRFGFDPPATQDAGLDGAPLDLVDDQLLCAIPEDSAPQGPKTCDPTTGWCWELPASSQANALHGVWQGQIPIGGSGSPVDKAFAVGERGIFMTRTDGKWERPEVLTSATLRGVFARHGLVVAVGDDGIRVHDGTGWTFQAEPDYALAAVTIDTDTIYVVGTNRLTQKATVFRRTVAGGSDFQLDSAFPSVNGTLNAVHASSGRVAVVGANGTKAIAYSSSAPGAWNQVAGISELTGTIWRSVWVGLDGAAKAVLFAGGESVAGTGLLKSSIAGVEVADPPCPGCVVHKIVGSDIDNLVLVSPNKVGLLDGEALVTTALPDHDPGGPVASIPLLSGFARNANDITVVGGIGLIFRFDGTQWTRQGNPDTRSYWNGHSTTIGGREVTAVASDTRIFYRSGDRAWASVPGLPQGSSLWINSGCDGWVGGFGGVGRFTSRVLGPNSLPAQMKIPHPSGMPVPTTIVLGMWARSDDDLWATGSPGIWHWDGNAWSEVADLRDVPCQEPGKAAVGIDVWGDDNHVVVVGGCGPPVLSGGFVQRCSIQAGCETLASELPDALFGVWGTGEQFIAVGSNNEMPVFRLINGTNVGPEQSPGPNIVGAAFTAVKGTSPTDVWAATDQGWVAHFDGLTWTAEPTVAATLLLSLWITPDNKLYAGGAFGALVSKDLNISP